MSVYVGHNDEEMRTTTEQFRKGSAEAFHILYQRYNRQVYRFCTRMMGNESAGKDAFQETFLKMYEHRSEFRGTNFGGWLFRISRNVCLNLIRSRKSYDSLEEETHGYHVPVTMDDNDVAMQRFIDRAIAQLPLELREVLILREYEDYTYQEIADIIGIDLSLAKVRLHRARLILRKLLYPLVQERYES